MYVFFSPFTRRTAQGPDDCRQTTTSPYRGMLTRSSTTKLRPCRAAAATASGTMRVRQIHVLLWLVALSEPAIDHPTTPPPRWAGPRFALASCFVGACDRLPDYTTTSGAVCYLLLDRMSEYNNSGFRIVRTTATTQQSAVHIYTYEYLFPLL